MKSWKELVSENKDFYFDSYTSAIDAGLLHAKQNGYTLNDDEVSQIIGFNSSRPADGKTTKVMIPLYKSNKEQKKALHIQVYNRGVDYKTFELNVYIA